jgi:hypothetical protein
MKPEPEACLPFCIPMSSHRNRERAANNNDAKAGSKTFRFFFVSSSPSPRALCRLIFFSTRIFIAHFKNYKMQFSDFFIGGAEKKEKKCPEIVNH